MNYIHRVKSYIVVTVNEPELMNEKCKFKKDTTYFIFKSMLKNVHF